MSPSHTDPTVIPPIVTAQTLGLTGVFFTRRDLISESAYLLPLLPSSPRRRRGHRLDNALLYYFLRRRDVVSSRLSPKGLRPGLTIGDPCACARGSKRCRPTCFRKVISAG